MTRAPACFVALALCWLSAFSPAAAADIVVGLALPLSGSRQAQGKAAETAAAKIIDDINAAGGVLGNHVALAVADDGCDKVTAEAAARTLLEKAPAVVIGHPCSGAAVAAAAIYAATGTVFIATGPRHPAVTAKRVRPAETIFRLAGRDDRQGEAAADWLMRAAPEKRMAIVHDRTGYAREIVDGARQALAAAGYTAVPVLTIVAGNRDYPEIADALKQQRIEAVLFAGYPDEATVILDGMRRVGMSISLLGSDALATSAFAAHAAESKSAVEVLLPTSGNVGSASSGSPEQALAAIVGSALAVWSEAARRAASTQPAAVATTLRAGTFEAGAFGSVSFDANGDARLPSFEPAVATGGAWRRKTLRGISDAKEGP